MSAPELKTSNDVVDALRARYAGNAWAFFENVSNATGGRASRWADALAMGLWPSRGLDMHGIEIKVSRSDLVRELADPDKADAVAQFCDFWWVAVGTPSVVKGLELPRTWGLLVPAPIKGGVTMKVAKEAAKLKPKSIDRGFLAAILRRASEAYDPVRIRQDVHAQIHAQVSKNIEEQYANRHQRDTDELRRLLGEEKKVTSDLRNQLRILTEQPFTPLQLGGALDLLQRLSGWQGAEKSLQILLEAIGRETKKTTETLQKALDVVQLMSGTTDEQKVSSG